QHGAPQVGQHSQQHGGGLNQTAPARPKKLALLERKPSVNLRAASPPPLSNSPITPITHKGYSSPPAGQPPHSGQQQQLPANSTPVPHTPVKIKEQKDSKEQLKKEIAELSMSPVAAQ
ncbi:hypothetical protein BIW11_12009, partial [Tropilaelaps mercedesae]